MNKLFLQASKATLFQVLFKIFQCFFNAVESGFICGFASTEIQDFLGNYFMPLVESGGNRWGFSAGLVIEPAEMRHDKMYV